MKVHCLANILNPTYQIPSSDGAQILPAVGVKVSGGHIGLAPVGVAPANNIFGGDAIAPSTIRALGCTNPTITETVLKTISKKV